MKLRRWTLVACAAPLLPLAACKTGGMGDAVSSASHTVAGAASGAASGAPSLVNVDLSNVLNNLAVQLHLDRANVPINAQIPINIAANVCGVSINILSVSNGKANCTAQTAPAELAQVVQQQMAAGGSVGGGAQGGSGATNGGTGTGGSSSTGANGTTGQSSGATTTAPSSGATSTAPSGGAVQPAPTSTDSPAPHAPPPPPAGTVPPTDPSQPHRN